MLAPSEFRLQAGSYQMRAVPTIHDIRHSNFLTLLAEFPTVQAFADRLERSHSQISQLKSRNLHSRSGKPREIGDEMARHIEHRMQRPRGWLDQQHAVLDTSPMTGVDGGEEEAMHLTQDTMTPVTLSWELLVLTSTPVPDRFRLVVPDDALAPNTPRGTELIFSRLKPPTPGAGVLVQDAAGRRYVRMYAEGLSGTWHARARGEAYVSLASDRDGLTVLATVEARVSSDV